MPTRTRSIFRPTSALALVALTSVGCWLGIFKNPNYDSWSAHTESTWDDEHPHITREDLESARSAALAGAGPVEVMEYGGTLGIFVWENRKLLAKMEEPGSSYSPPQRLEGFDRNAYFAEYRDAVVAIYDKLGSYGESGQTAEALEADLALRTFGGWRALAMLDCDAELAHQFPTSTCGHVSWDSITALCDQAKIDAMCAKVFEATPDLDDRYYLMNECGKYTTGDTWTEMREGIARWATAEQLAFYDEMRQKHDEHHDRMMSAARSAAADADAENQRRLDAYAAQQAEYQENRSAIEDVSQIGALDPSKQAPDAPELITSASVNITHIDSGSVALPPVQLTVVNKCGENMTLSIGNHKIELPANVETATDLPKCLENICFQREHLPIACTELYESMTVEILEDCAHIRQVRAF